MIKVVLYQPEIPQNTGNIARTCAATNCELHLIHPLGFMWNEAKLRRAGLDYWPHVQVVHHSSWESYLNNLGQQRVWAFSTKGQVAHSQVRYAAGDHLLFGPETRGLPPEVLALFTAVRIPMPGPVRSLNLAVSVGVGVFEALRQLG